MRTLLIPALFAATAALPTAAAAQSNVEGRVGKLESEMRAVQRKVFPGSEGQYLQPEVTAPALTASTAPGTPASSALIDINARVASLESQMATLTGQIEENENRIRQMQDALDTYRRTNDARVKALEPAADTSRGTAGASIDSASDDAPPPRAVRSATQAPRAAAATSPARSDPARARLVAAVAKPASGDTPEDEYLYGFRLWSANLYPEAATQLKKVVAEYPKHRRASYARNLLGRAYLDDGKPSLASVTFYDNYKTLPDGERAPESLYYLAQALTTLKKPADACKVYGELTEVYGAKIGAAMKADIARGRTAAKCG
jgi:TolA-binding protein